MNQADGYATRKSIDKKSLILTSREAVQTAEDAREISVKRMETDRIGAESQAAADREAKAKAQTEAAVDREAKAKAQTMSAEADTANARRERDEAERQKHEAQADALQQQQAARAEADRNRVAAAAAAASADAQLQQAQREKKALRAQLLQTIQHHPRDARHCSRTGRQHVWVLFR